MNTNLSSLLTALQADIMNAPVKMGRATEMHGATKQAYKEGHRDARRAAVELVLAFANKMEESK